MLLSDWSSEAKAWLNLQLIRIFFLDTHCYKPVAFEEESLVAFFAAFIFDAVLIFLGVGVTKSKLAAE